MSFTDSANWRVAWRSPNDKPDGDHYPRINGLPIPGCRDESPRPHGCGRSLIQYLDTRRDGHLDLVDPAIGHYEQPQGDSALSRLNLKERSKAGPVENYVVAV